MSNDYPLGSRAKWLETVAPVTGNADGVDIVCSAWKHAAVMRWSLHHGQGVTSLAEQRYKLILDRMVGNHMLHKKLAIVGAGNLESDNALVSPMSTALQSRMVHLQLRMDVAEWLDWARSNNIDFRITSYVEFKKEVLYTFQPDHTDHTYASPRTWHFADAIIKVIKSVEDTDAQSLLGGCLSEGVASEFIEFCRIESEIPKMRDIIADPGNVRVPSEASFLYLLCGSIGANAIKDHLDAIATYVKRFPAEFQVIGLKNIVKRDNTAMAHPAIQKWIATSGAKLF